MATRNTIAASIAANVALGIAIALLARNRLSPAPNDTVTFVTNVVTNVTVAVIPEIEATATNTPRFAGFRWAAIESKEYPAYVANLRAVGCPEKTVRDIILPEIEELYALKRAELSTELQFWVSGAARAEANRERYRRLTELNAEQTALIKQVLGLDWETGSKSVTRGQEFEYMIAYLLTTTLSPAQAKLVMSRIDAYEAQQRQLHQEARGVLTPEDKVKLRELVTEFRKEISKLMSAQEFEEFNLKAAAIEQLQLAERLSEVGLTLSPNEFREIVRLQSAGSDMFGGLFQTDLEDDDENPLAKIQRQKEAETEIRTLLGESRYAQFQEVADDSLRYSLQFAKARDLPTSVGRALYEVQQAAQEEARTIKYDESLSPTQRRHALQAVREQTESVLSETLGEELLKTYRNGNGSWLKTLDRN